MKTVIGLFDNFTEARETLQDLVSSGFNVDDISILANGLLGQNIDAPGIDHLERLRVQGIGEIGAFGPLVSDIQIHDHEELESDVLVRALSDTGVPVETAQSFVDGIRRGGTLETVKVDDEEVDRVVAIMKLHASSGVSREDIVEEVYDETVIEDIAEEDDANAEMSASPVEPILDSGMEEPLTAAPNPDLEERTDDTTLAATMDDKRTDADSDLPVQGLQAQDVQAQDLPAQDLPAQDLPQEPRVDDRPAHEFGQNLRSDERFGGNDWSVVEEHAKQTWEAKNPDTWEHIKDVVRHAWEKVRGKA